MCIFKGAFRRFSAALGMPGQAAPRDSCRPCASNRKPSSLRSSIIHVHGEQLRRLVFLKSDTRPIGDDLGSRIVSKAWRRSQPNARSPGRPASASHPPTTSRTCIYLTAPPPRRSACSSRSLSSKSSRPIDSRKPSSSSPAEITYGNATVESSRLNQWSLTFSGASSPRATSVWISRSRMELCCLQPMNLLALGARRRGGRPCCVGLLGEGESQAARGRTDAQVWRPGARRGPVRPRKLPARHPQC